MKTTNAQTTRPSTSASCVAAARRLKHPVLPVLPAALTLAAAVPSGAQCPGCGTAVGSVVSGETWTASGSPYCVNSDVMVVGLTIQSNVTVRFCGSYEFQVLGSLRVNGASNAPVVFTPQDAQAGWKGIVIQDAPAASFNWAIIEGATNSGVRSLNTSVAFTNCVIRNNTAPFYGGGVNLSVPNGQSLVMQDCLISSNAVHLSDDWQAGGGGGVYINGGTKGTSLFSGCSIVGNLALGGSRGCGMYLSCSNSVIQRCSLVGNHSGSNYVAGGGGIFAQGNCTIRNSTIAKCWILGNGSSSRFGDAVQYSQSGGSLSIANCSFLTNGVGSGASTATIALDGDSGIKFSLVNCIIVGSSGGAIATGYYYGQARIENCSILNNKGYAVEGYSYYTTQPFFITNSILFFNNSGGKQFYYCTLA